MANAITLTSGMRQNLFSLQQTTGLMEQTQTRLASGKKINSPLDDPVAFFAAQGHEQRATDLAARKDEMSEAIQTVKAANEGIEGIMSTISGGRMPSKIEGSRVTGSVTITGAGGGTNVGSGSAVASSVMPSSVMP